jgi:hypothetical protein
MVDAQSGEDGKGADGRAPDASASACDVCYGTPGKYPIHNRFGHLLYEIACPECYGTGIAPEEAEPEFEPF